MKLSDLCNVYSGYALKNFNSNGIGVPVIKIGNINSVGNLDLNNCQYTTDEVNEKYFSKYGDIYVALSGATTGKTGIMVSNEKYIINQRVGIIRCIDTISYEFIKYFLIYKTDEILAEASGCAQPNISPKQLAVYELPNYSIEKMCVIANKLNRIKSIINKRQQELDKLDELVKARFVEMFGDLDNNQKEFEVKSIQDVCEQIKDGTHQTPEYTEDAVNGFKFLSSKDVTSGKIDWSNIKHIPPYLHEELYKRIAPKQGDVLLAKNGTTGVAAVVDTDEVFDIYVSLALLRPIEINSIYLWAVINSDDTQKQFNCSLKGIGVPNLHLGEIKKTKILVPPIELQNQFATFVKQIDKSKVAVQKEFI